MNNNSKNLLYFEDNSMRGLHAKLNDWQSANEKRFLSLDIQRDGDNFCCLALTNPSEVILVSENDLGRKRYSRINEYGQLLVKAD